MLMIIIILTMMSGLLSWCLCACLSVDTFSVYGIFMLPTHMRTHAYTCAGESGGGTRGRVRPTHTAPHRAPHAPLKASHSKAKHSRTSLSQIHEITYHNIGTISNRYRLLWLHVPLCYWGTPPYHWSPFVTPLLHPCYTLVTPL
jgi:hypothetical protein